MDLLDPDEPGRRTGLTAAAEPGHTPPPRLPRAPLAAGDDVDWQPHSPRRRRWALVAAAVAPWAFLAVLFVGRPPTDPATVAAPPPAPTPDEPGPGPGTGREPDAAGAPPAQAPTDIDHEVLATTDHPVDTRARALGLAVTAARTWLSSQPGPTTLAGIGHDRDATRVYVEHLTVESVDHPGRGHAVVTIHAVVLPVEDTQYGSATSVRVAVPVGFDAHRSWLAGQPWLLTTDDLVVVPPDVTPVDDPDLQLAAVEAVARAGYTRVELVELARGDGWPFVARVTGAAPHHDGEVGEHVLWLRVDVNRLVVAGTAPPADAAPDTEVEP